jgi:hypothetical protein
MIRRVSGLALGMALMTSTAFAVDTDVPSKPWAGPNCIKYTIGTTVYAFNTSDISSNADGRKTAVNDALLSAYPVQVSVAERKRVQRYARPNQLQRKHGQHPVAGDTGNALIRPEKTTGRRPAFGFSPLIAPPRSSEA